MKPLISEYQDSFDAIKKYLEGPKQRIVVFIHERPDGDALGSALGWAHFCKSYDHEVLIISPTVFPVFLAHIPGTEQVCIYEEEAERANTYLEQATLVFCLDFGATKRLGGLKSWLEATQLPVVVIDHHPHPEAFPQWLIWNTKAAATASLIYEIIEGMKAMDRLNGEAATALYMGLVTDTGNFVHDNTTPRTHRIAAKLMEKGIETSALNALLHGNIPLSRLRFIGHCLMHRLTYLPKQGVAYIAIPKEDFAKFHVSAGETAGLVHYALNLAGVRIAVLVTEHKEQVRFSFRSRGKVFVNDIAEQFFHGGGHPNAAGGCLEGDLKEGLKTLKKVFEKVLTTCSHAS